ncbi:MAG: hypothetical protein NTZ05_11355 [Chloroflexi bacterium]|nr:hypothetical protein [Chloroflexota bacterium]
MAVTVIESRREFTRLELITFSHGRLGQAAFRAAMAALLRNMNPVLTTDILDVQEMADRYAEQVTTNAEGDITKYFAMTRGTGYTLGGIATGMTELPLTVRSRDPMPSATAIASIGEAVVGWYFEQQALTPISRPVAEFPDLVFRDTAEGTYYLVEVKATQEPNIDSNIRDAMMSLFTYVRHLLLLPGDMDYECCAVGVIIRPGLDYELRVIRAAVR